MSKKYLYYISFLLLLFLIQTAAVEVFSKSRYLVPQLLLLYLIVFASAHTLVETVWMGMLAGFLAEFFSGLFFGSVLLGLAVTAAAVYFVTRNLTAQEISGWPAVLLVILASLFFNFSLYLVHNAAGLLHIAASLPLRYFLSGATTLTVISNLIFFYPVRAVFRILEK